MIEPSPDLQIVPIIKREAESLGFDQIGFAQLDPPLPEFEYLYTFLKEGRHGDMAWMERTAEHRVRPLQLWPEARTAIVLGVNYTPNENPLGILSKKERGAISVYAHGEDYHQVIHDNAQKLITLLKGVCNAQFKIFVDTAPLMEKPLAASAGLGWQGKHTNLVSRSFGSWLFLCVILTDAALPPDQSSKNFCGSCQRCLDVCPTKAFPAPYQLDARRCISYLTIEHKSQVPREFRGLIGNRIFGCDDCLAVCPWNKFASTARETRLFTREESDNPPLKDLLVLTQETFRRRFSGSALKRTGRDRFVRNVLIAAGNSGDVTLIPYVLDLLKDASPLVRGMAVWAAYKLLEPEEFTSLRTQHLPSEPLSSVHDEWLTEAL